jgi:hypothetical protein
MCFMEYQPDDDPIRPKNVAVKTAKHKFVDGLGVGIVQSVQGLATG